MWGISNSATARCRVDSLTEHRGRMIGTLLSTRDNSAPFTTVKNVQVADKRDAIDQQVRCVASLTGCAGVVVSVRM